MSMDKKKLAALQQLRERHEDRARKELLKKQAAEQGPRSEALRAKDEMESEVAARAAMAGQWSTKGKLRGSAADQITARFCLARKDGEVVRSVETAAQAAMVLVAAVTATAESAVLLRQATVAKEKSRHGAERHRELLSQQQLKADEAEQDDETEVQVMARFARPVDGVKHG